MPQALSHRYRGGFLIRDHQLIKEDLFVVNGKIAPPQHYVDEIHDVDGLIIAPGYIDLQVNGAFGVDFASRQDGLDEVAKKLRNTGVLHFLPTLVSSPLDLYPAWKAYYSHHPAVLGLHFEGPF